MKWKALKAVQYLSNYLALPIFKLELSKQTRNKIAFLFEWYIVTDILNLLKSSSS